MSITDTTRTDELWDYAIDRILNSRYLASAAPHVIEALWALMDEEITRDEFDEAIS